MLRLEDSNEALLRAGQRVGQRARRFWDGFANFALRDNVLEVAVAFMLVAAAFTKVVSSLVSDVILPIVSLLPILQRNLDEKFAVLRNGDSGGGYKTVAQALDDGAVVMTYGSFINQLVRFFSIGLTLYTIALVYSRVSSDSIIKYQVKCRYCRKYVSEKIGAGNALL
ncbi:MAG: hypothetical protein M1840_007541 [Geoglossum simile]|nr:MAG: hypothetical protein M1840_007541 [Geoglossum simile]